MNDTPTSDATASANPDDSIDWRGMGDIFSPSPVAHHDVATSHMDALDFIPHLDLDTADHHMVVSAILPGMSVSPVPAAPDITPPSATQPAAIYVHIPDDGSPDEIEVAPIVTKLNTNNNNTGTPAAEDTTQPKDVVLHPAPEDIAVQQEVAQSGIVAAPEAQAPLAAATTPPVITKMEAGAATNDGGVLLLGDVPSVSVSMVKAEGTNNIMTNTNMKNTPKRARGPGQAQVLVQQHNTSTTTMGVAKGRVDKASSSISLKEKREREAKQFPPELLLESGIGGTTSAEVRKMSPDERQLVHYKRKLRNRESARRSRQKRQATLTDIHEELGELMNATNVAMNTAQHLANRNKSLVKKLEVAQAELRALKTSIEKDNNNSINEARKVGA